MADLIKENTFAKFMKGSLVFIGFSEVCTPVTKITKHEHLIFAKL